MQLPVATINPDTKITLQRMLPTPGEVLVQTGQQVTALNPVARATIPSRYRVIDVTRQLGRPQVDMDEVMLAALDAGAGMVNDVSGLKGDDRLGYVAANWAYYVDHIGKALNVREGGLNWHGALIGGGIATGLWYVARAARGQGTDRPPVPHWRDLLDVLAPGLALGSAFGWLGALLTGSAYGAEASGFAPPLSWLTADLPDIYGVDARRFMTQPLMIGVEF